MRKAIVCLCVVVVLSFCFGQVAQADEISELKAQMKAMEARHQKEIAELKARIETLEAERAARIETPKEMEERVIAIEERLKEPYEGGLLSFKGKNWEIGGELELEFVDTQDDTNIGEPEPHFQIDKFSLIPRVHFAEDITLEADLYFQDSSARVDEAFVTFAKLPFNSELKVGLDDRFIMPKRMTERWPLAATAFWKDEEFGITWSTEQEPFYGILTWSQGLEIDETDVGEDDSSGNYAMLHDDSRRSNYGGIKEVGVGLGLKQELGDLGEVDILGFGYFNELTDNDISTLKSDISSYTSNDDEQYRIGANFDYTLRNFNFFAQYIDAKDGDLDRYAWYVQPSYKVELPFGWKYCNDHTFLVRYGEYDVDTTKAFGNPCTWGREELTFAVITEVAKNIKLKSEYTIDDEKTGDGEVDNDELVVQLELMF